MNEIASPIESGFLPRNDECIDYQGEGWDIGAGGANVPPFSLIINAIVIAREESRFNRGSNPLPIGWFCHW
jgi:hypothetical protein